MHPRERLAWAAQEQHGTEPRPSKHGVLAQGPGVACQRWCRATLGEKRGQGNATCLRMGTERLAAGMASAWRHAGALAGRLQKVSGHLVHSEEKTRHLQRVINCSLKSEPCGNIAKYMSPFPPKMQQILLLFIFLLTASLLASPSKIFEGKKKKKGGGI